jgi:antibiotic biosynthesis monooxygenase (ABM) superfamily enzyme
MSKRRLLAVGVALVVLAAVSVGGCLSVQAQVATPKTLIHHVTLKWNAGVSDADKQKVIDDLKAILADVPGARNLWVKSVKVQPQGFSQTFVIEFENEAALKAYAEHPKKKAWNEFYYSIRETSYNSVTTN